MDITGTALAEYILSQNTPQISYLASQYSIHPTHAAACAGLRWLRANISKNDFDRVLDADHIGCGRPFTAHLVYLVYVACGYEEVKSFIEEFYSNNGTLLINPEFNILRAEKIKMYERHQHDMAQLE